jgi:MFS family permease
MNIAPYRLVLGLPGLKLLMVIGFLARIPATAAGMVTTLHVITALHLDYAAAGVAGALGMAGVGLGSPLLGRLVDRLGTRPIMIVTTVAQCVYWLVAPELSYPVLVACAFVSGLLTIPIFTVMRQFVAALTPVEQRRTAFALDSMAVELSYMLGPALAVAVVTGLNSQVAMYLVGAGLVVAGISLIVLNPPIRSEAEAAQGMGAPLRLRQWITPGMVAVLCVTSATTFILSATELSVVAVLNNGGVTQFTGLVIGLWCLYSLVGGFVYGALPRTISPLALIFGLGLLTIPLGLLAGAPWWWLILALIPTGLVCAPSLASTVDTVSKWVPARARGEAMGLHGAALTIGIACGAPVAGAIIDAFGPGWGFAVAGACGALLVAVVLPFWPRRTSTPPTPEAGTAAKELAVPAPASR